VSERDLTDQSFGDLARRLSEDTSTLVRQELALARVEMQEKGKRLGLGSGLLGTAGLLGLYALGLVLAGVVLVLVEIGITAWLSALIVAVVVASIAGVLAMVGRSKVQEATPPTPERAIRTTKEDIDYVKARAQR
jgi:uncharacterized membrane protein YqjE